MEQGLAQQMAGPQKSMQMQMPTVDEVVALLMQGISPEELVKAGIPQELIMQAVSMLEQQMAAKQQAIPVEQQGGLAAQSLGMGM